MNLFDIALTTTPGLGLKGTVRLLSEFPSAEAVFSASLAELTSRTALREPVARAIVSRAGFAAAQAQMRHIERQGLQAVASTDADYPALLREMTDYPHVIYTSGSLDAFRGNLLSVVGTREATSYGLVACERLIAALAERVPDLVIVSGLAFGIDVAAHRAALAAKVRTIAVLPTPLPQITPPQHAAIARDIVEHGGLLMSEVHSGSRLFANAYVARNRLIAGLSLGTLIVESPARGGSLITAEYANDYNRTVMALPGRVTDKASAGTNYLIRNSKAQMVTSAEDIIEALNWDLGRNPVVAPSAPTTPLTADEAGLLGCFRTSDPLTMDDLHELCGLDMGALSALLLGLEMSGAVKQLPGNRYVKI